MLDARLPLAERLRRVAVGAFESRGADYDRYSSARRLEAVVMCAHDAGVVSDRFARDMLSGGYIETRDYYFASVTDPLVTSAREMLDVPPGSFLGFFRKNGHHRYLVHGMISLGGGVAAGTGNEVVGAAAHVLGLTPGWEIINLAAHPGWTTSGKLDGRWWGSAPMDLDLRYRTPENIARAYPWGDEDRLTRNARRWG